MLDQAPSREEIVALVGERRYDVWTALCERIEEQYDMERLWNPGGKAWNYEYKYRLSPRRENAVRLVCQRTLHRIYVDLWKGRAGEVGSR